MRSLNFKAGDVIIILSIAYDMVKHTLNHLCSTVGVKVVVLPVWFPGKGRPPVSDSNQTILQAIESAIRSNPTTKLVSMCHISSTPAIILPVAEVVALCKRHGVLSLIDGAHSIGQIGVDIHSLAALGMDFWVGNIHKWMYGPKGSAVMWMKPTFQEKVVPPVISSAYTTGVTPGQSNYLSRFQYTGTRDYSAWCSIGASIDFRSAVGEEDIRSWNLKLSKWAQDYLAKLWKTEILVPPEMTAMMSHTRLPEKIKRKEEVRWLTKCLLEQYGIFVVIFSLVNQNGEESYWTRLSAQIFLEESDIIHFGNTVLKLIENLPQHSNL
uniref:Aminotransferase class V domain-containing protein n=1 Tax=Arcella intermedia TaxID=1963864 RepID=A0A6B2L844_9EUKA